MTPPGFEKPGMRPPAPEPLLLSGTVPGVLDPSQSSRLLRNPLSILSFASFDPFTASPEIANSASSSGADRCRSKRIVIEYQPEGPTTWRWVPNARKDDGVNDEGEFVNRVVSICGTLYRMTQDQWDIYKLDPQYDCCIKGGTGLPTITLKGPGPQPSPFPQPWASNTASMRPASPQSSSTLKPDNTLKADATMRTAASPSDHESDGMSVDDDFIDDYVQPQSPTTPKRATKDLPRRSRPYPDFNFTPNTRPMAGPSSAQKPKRSREERSPGRQQAEEEEDIYEEGTRNTKFYTPNAQKRARTLSPSAKNRNLTNAKLAREKAKARRLREQKERYKQKRQSEQDTFEIPTPVYEAGPKFTDIPEEEEEMAQPEHGFQPPPAEPEPTPAPQPEPEPVDEEEASRQRIAESVRKLKELNLNRAQERERERASRPPDPPEARKQQRARTEAPSNQEEERRKKFEAAMQEELRRKQEQEEERRQEALRQQQQERRRAQLRAKAAHEREIRTKEWDERFYDHLAALDRYRKQAVFFDKEKFTLEENPLVSLDIPWPTLTHPLYIRAENLEFDAIMQFLEVAKMYLSNAEYSSMVAKSRLRFHPDRWSNRRLLDAVEDINERNIMQTLITTVSQAMNYAYDMAKTKHA